MANKVAVYRKEHFNAAHRLANPTWSVEENDRVFGKCALPNYHGHNYELIVSVTGEIDTETGYVIDLKIVKDLIKNKITDRFDHKNLNLDCTEFLNLNPTAENIAVVCWDLLRSKLDAKYELSIKLWETENNLVEYNGQ